MDNTEQAYEIQKYQMRLSKIAGKQIDCNLAALIWIRKYAKIWRLRHALPQRICTQS